MKKLFTERFGGVAPRVREELDSQCATGLLSILEARIAENWFGEAFPAECEDGGQNAGCDISKLKGASAAYNLIWPEDWRKSDQIPADGSHFRFDRVFVRAHRLAGALPVSFLLASRSFQL